MKQFLIWLGVVSVLLCAPVVMSAQQVVYKTGAVLDFDLSADPVDYTFKLVVDDGAPTLVVAPCVQVGAIWTCSTPVPALGPGSHTLKILAVRTVNGTEYHAASASAPLAVLVVVVQVPTNLRLRDGSGG